MIARAGSGWQYALADLSLILFLTCAAALGEAGAAPSALRPPALAEPVAIWREGEGAPSLREWLAAQPADPRLRLTIVAPVGGRDPASALATARALMADAGNRRARIVIEPGVDGALAATLTWDLAQPLPLAAQIDGDAQ